MSQGTIGRAPDLISTVSDLVAAYVSNNHVAPIDLPMLIQSVHDAVAVLAAPAKAAPAETADLPTPAQVRKSIQHDGIISFLDGKSYKTMKRHLATYGLTPETYRERFGLRDDYPMVAPAYSEHRSSLAKAVGLGVRSRPTGGGSKDETTPKRRRHAA